MAVVLMDVVLVDCKRTLMAVVLVDVVAQVDVEKN